MVYKDYLNSGYVIECIVKYGIYDLVGYSRTRNVTELNESGLTYQDHIRHHRFARYTEHLNRLIKASIPLVNNIQAIDPKAVQLYRAWNTEIRYSYDIDIRERQ